MDQGMAFINWLPALFNGMLCLHRAHTHKHTNAFTRAHTSAPFFANTLKLYSSVCACVCTNRFDVNSRSGVTTSLFAFMIFGLSYRVSEWWECVFAQSLFVVVFECLLLCQLVLTAVLVMTPTPPLL